ncbi:MAG TPA: DUF4139 domain-containing protein [Stellaceae bacterium]|nr:DUF4139 domain-containing protein [Stellaceae bacterium]
MLRLLRECSLGLVLVIAIGMPAQAAELTLKRVMLSSGGVGYFEYETTVDGDATLTLDVALDQVDDVLKSLIVYNNGGHAGAITLPGREPLAQGFADLPFDQSALASLTDLLNALQGAEIRIGGDKPLIGRLVHAEDETVHHPDGSSETRTRVSVLGDSGLRQLTLKDLDAVEFTDPALAAEVKTALSRLAAYRAQGRRQLTIATSGAGKRTVRVGYVVAMPLWKATYRLSLPADPAAGSAHLQGWAVLENFSGQSWNDVELTLLSGSPVTFRQALYQSYYVPRPIVPVEAGNRTLPPADTGTFADDLTKAENALPAPSPAPLAPSFRQQLAAGLPAPPPPPASAPAIPPAAIEAASTQDEATQIAFTLATKVSVAAGQSLVVPLIDRELPARRIDFFQPATDAHHPLAAIELTNAADSGLPPGVLTLYQQSDAGSSYLGDARLAALPAGDKRLLSYAIDTKVTVDQSTDTQQSIVKATVADGVMRLTRLQRRTATYQVNSAAPPPALVIEQHRLAGWNLAAPTTADRTTDAYRVTAALDPKGNGKVTIVEEKPAEEQVQLLDLDDHQIGVYLAAKSLDPALHQVFADLAQRRSAVSRQQAELDRLNEERTRLTDDETRLRDNYTALKDDPAMRKTTLDKLKAAEVAIDVNANAIAKASTALDAARAELAAYVAALKV